MGKWDLLERRKKSLEALYTTKGIKSYMSLTKTDFKDAGLYGLLQKYGSKYELICQTFPNELFFPWEGEGDAKVTRGFWQNNDNKCYFIEVLANKKKYMQYNDLYNLTGEIIKENGGGGLIDIYNGSIYMMIKDIYPSYEWVQHMFNVDNDYYKLLDNHYTVMKYLESKLNISSEDGWYNISAKDVIPYGGSTLVYKHYNGSIYNMIQALYPNYHFKFWKFTYSPRIWQDIIRQREFTDNMFKESGYTNKEDWYLITRNDIIYYGGSQLLHLYGQSPSKIILSLYPEYNLNRSEFFHHKGERILSDFLELNQIVFISNKYFDWCRNSYTNSMLPFDFIIEELKVIIELDGWQHFKDGFKRSHHDNRKRDIIKMKYAIDNNYSIIRLPWEYIMFKDKYSWKDIFKSTIKLYNIPTITFIGSNIYKDYINDCKLYKYIIVDL